MRVDKIISGGQTGADRGGLDAAVDLGIPHGGWCPRGRRAEDGTVPAAYRLMETETAEYAERTERNVVEADATVVFTFGEAEGGSGLTLDLARRHGKPHLHVDLLKLPPERASDLLRDWVAGEGVGILNVAGSRESNAPGIQALVRTIVGAALAEGPGRGAAG
jgi:hypothetical protein